MAADIFRGLGIGFDAVLEAYDSLPNSMKDSSKYPPYRIHQKSNDCFLVEVDVAGFDKEEISISLSDMTLKVHVKEDDEAFYDSLEDGCYMVFLVSRFFDLEKASVERGVLSMKFVNSFKQKRDIEITFDGTSSVVSTPEPPGTPWAPVIEAPKVVAPVVETPVLDVPSPVSEPNVVTPPVVEAPVTVVEPTPKPEPLPAETKVIVVNQNDYTVPTTSVAVPPELPQVVQAQVRVEPLINTVSKDPQVHINLVPASNIKMTTETVWIPTADPTKSDIIVTMDPKTSEALSNANVDAAQVVGEAIKQANPVLPPRNDDGLVPVESANTPMAFPINVPEVVQETLQSPLADQVPHSELSTSEDQLVVEEPVPQTPSVISSAFESTPSESSAVVYTTVEVPQVVSQEHATEDSVLSTETPSSPSVGYSPEGVPDVATSVIVPEVSEPVSSPEVQPVLEPFQPVVVEDVPEVVHEIEPVVLSEPVSVSSEEDNTASKVAPSESIQTTTDVPSDQPVSTPPEAPVEKESPPPVATFQLPMINSQ